MVLKKKETLILLVIFVACLSLVFSFFYKNEKLKNENQKKMVELSLQVDDQRANLVQHASKRSQAQKNFLIQAKLLNSKMKNLIEQSDSIKFEAQADFDTYELIQNQIQSVITDSLIKGLQSKQITSNVNWKQSAKDLELREKELNQARMLFSQISIELSKRQSKKPVTFISDIQLLAFQDQR
jgi:hypothetical protein